MTRMHAANIDDSPRLQKVRDFLRRNGGATTREISKACDVYAINSIVAELRANGFTVNCNPVKGQRGVYRYELIEENQMQLFGRI
ncbi:MAG: hypothetical protein M0023_04305 [Desulfobacteraceae bacterium]|nr:hypothetical protein [Desulfobacteraceae bacterium]